MATVVRGNENGDEAVHALKAALDGYEQAHPGAVATLYRYNPASIRIRVLDRRFLGMSKSRRHAQMWEFLAERVPEDVMAEVSVILTLAPEEQATSMMNLEFEEPSRSEL